VKMVKKNKKLLGNHMGCVKQGRVWYNSSKVRGWRYCDKCGESTHKGHTVFTTQEAAFWK